MIDILVRITIDPAVAGYVAALLVGEPELGHELHSTCWREAPMCQIRGEHAGDAGSSRAVWRKAMRMGLLDPGCQWHWYTDDDGEPRNFSTRGSWGTMWGYTWPHFAKSTGISCAPIQLLDVPIFGALAAALRMQAACDDYGACNRHDRHLLWSGLSTWLRRRPTKKEQSS